MFSFALTRIRLIHIFLTHLVIILGIFFSISLPLSPDEAHYYLWSQNLDWSFYSKGPLVAILIRVTTAIFGKNEYAVRLPTLLFLFGTIYLVFRYLSANFKKNHSIILYLAIFSSVSTWYQAYLMTTDGPVVFFWLSSCLCFLKYFERQGLRLFNLSFGILSVGLGIWCKYTILIVPFVFSLVFLREIKCQRVRRSDFIIYCVLLLFFIVPILIWNSQHEWVNVAHNVGHLGVNKNQGLNPKYFFDFLGGQLGIFGLFLFSLPLCVLKIRQADYSFYKKSTILTALLLFGVCLCVSFFKRIYPNWTMPAFVVLMLFLSNELFQFYQNRKKLFLASVFVNYLITCLGILLLQGFSFGVPGKYLPTKKLIGWRDFSFSVQRAASEVMKSKFIMTESYDFASELGFYANNLVIFNIPVMGRRMNQFDIWQNESEILEKFKDQDVLLVLSDQNALKQIETRFASIKMLEPIPYFSINYAGSSLRTAYLYVGHGFTGQEFEPAIKR